MNGRTAGHPEGRFRGAFDLASAPLSGRNLIEAGAGTGKTYAIAGLFVRLLLESGLSVGEILVVTYTVAATDELRERIRRRIRDALGAFRTGPDDPFLAALVAKFPSPGERGRAAERLSQAMRDFDDAAILTIHGFCQRVLRENAFFGCEPFETEMLADDLALRTEIVEDFWRNRLYDTAPEIAAHALSEGFSPEMLLAFTGGRTPLPEWEILPATAPPCDRERTELVAALLAELTRLAHEWPSGRDAVAAALSGAALNANVYGRRVPALLARMDAFLAPAAPSLALFDGFAKFCPEAIAAAARKGCSPPLHPLFERCGRILALAERLRGLLDLHLLHLKRELLRTVARELPERKKRQNVQYFDDLLLRLRGALARIGGGALADAIRRRYRAALIDEFQDTDPVQYDIFRNLFGDGDATLFLIGDPKQAIYSFRGADIFAYLAAARQVDAVYTLDANWRSAPALLQAVNALFSQREHPFLFPEIAFRPAIPGNAASFESFTIDGRCEPPFECWMIGAGDGDPGGDPLPKGVARGRAADAVAAEIARLLRMAREGRVRIGKRPLSLGDIAILVRTNREARLCGERLAARRIPSVLHSSGNLFDTPEAWEIERLMLAAQSPDREELLLAALATDMAGLDLAALDALRRDDAGLDGWKEAFARYHALWRQQGFLRMFRHFLDREQVPVRLLAFADGERRLTNCLHIAEVLQREAAERDLGMAALIQWLSERRSAPAPAGGPHQLRLPSDAEAVRIVTIHKSKGLQYPVVFCPFPWGGTEKGGGPLFFHDPHEGRTIVDLGSEMYEAHRRLSARESLAEEVRMFYVALTRAQHRCTFVWGRINKAGRSAPAFLLHGQDGAAEGEEEAAAGRYAALSGAALAEELSRLERLSGGSLRLREMPPAAVPPPAPDPPPLAPSACRAFSGRIDRSWRVASFTQLTEGAPWRHERPDRDDEPDADAKDGPGREGRPPEAEEPDPVFALPRGSRSGVLLHGLLEQIDFAEADPARWDGAVDAALVENGLGLEWRQAVRTLLGRVVRQPLMPTAAFAAPPDDPEPILLSQIGRDMRIHELEFYVPLRRLTRESLCGLFGDAPAAVAADPESFPANLRRLQFDPVRGFLKGFIDMVFRWRGRYYLVDWKSNHLGDDRDDYRRERLAEAMARHHYTLQYHLYLVALDRYLRLRLPGYDYESHIGGVFYLFLRGMNPDWGAGCGVFFDRPDAAHIEALGAGLIDTGEGR